MIAIPPIPERLIDEPDLTLPSKEWMEWARAAFIDDGKSRLFNEEHEHLTQATLGFLLTNVSNGKQGKRILGTCGMGEPTGDKWKAAQRRQQLTGWFGEIPDFVITLDAIFLSTVGPLETCALVEHELLHAGVEKDFRGIKRRKNGRPVYTMRAHDVEAFATEVRRYGAWKIDLQEFKEAIEAEPIFGRVKLEGLCGCGATIG